MGTSIVSIALFIKRRDFVAAVCYRHIITWFIHIDKDDVCVVVICRIGDSLQSTNFVAYMSNSSDDVSSGSCKQLRKEIQNNAKSLTLQVLITYRGLFRACVVLIPGEARLGFSYCRTHEVKQVTVGGCWSSCLHRLYEAISHSSCVLSREDLATM